MKRYSIKINGLNVKATLGINPIQIFKSKNAYLDGLKRVASSILQAGGRKLNSSFTNPRFEVGGQEFYVR